MINRELIKDFFLKKSSVEGIEREIKLEEIGNKALGIVGPRKSGKTWLLLMKSKDGMYVDLVDLAFKKLKPEEFFKVIEIYSSITGKDVKKIFIDEIQEMYNWEYLVLSLMNRNYKVYITGSSSKILKREFVSTLRGKCITKILLPFSFREFLIAKGFKESFETFEGRGKLLRMLKLFLIDGGYPEVVLNESKKNELWSSYLNEIFYRDFVERYKIRNLELGRTVLEHFLQNFSSLVSINRIKKFLKGKVPLTDRTLYEYAAALEETLNIFFVRKYSEKIYERASWPRKVYVCDVGLTNLLSYSENLGKRMENIVFLELLRKTNERPLMEIFYLKINNSEVDFVIKEGLRIKQLTQVTYASSKDEIEQREIKALEKAYELFKSHRPELIIITWDYEDVLKKNNIEIKCLPLWKWLLRV